MLLFPASSAPRALLLLAFLVPLVVGCDSNDPEPPIGNAGTYTGTLAGAQASGALEVTIDGTDASGAFTLVGGAARSAMPPLSGSYNPDTGALHLEGGGYTFDGTTSGGVLSGTWTGPGGTSGSFTAYLGGEGNEVSVYCGTFDGTQDHGTLNVVIRGAALLGVAVNQNGTASGFRGSVSGSAVSVYLPDNPNVVIATGTLSADRSAIDGSFDNQQGDVGTWQADRCDG